MSSFIFLITWAVTLQNFFFCGREIGRLEMIIINKIAFASRARNFKSYFGVLFVKTININKFNQFKLRKLHVSNNFRQTHYKSGFLFDLLNLQEPLSDSTLTEVRDQGLTIVSYSIHGLPIPFRPCCITADQRQTPSIHVTIFVHVCHQTSFLSTLPKSPISVLLICLHLLQQ